MRAKRPDKRLSRVFLLLVVGVLALSLACPLTAWAQEPSPPENGDNDDDPGLVQRIVQSITHVMTFPVETMTAALTKSISRILGGAIEHAAEPFVAVLGALVLGDVAHGPSPEIYEPAWRLLRNVSIALWPLTLALVVVWAARDGVTDNPVTFSNLKGGLIEWALSVVLSVASIYLIHLGLDLSRGMTTMILTDLWGTVNMQTLVGVFFNAGLWVALAALAPAVAIFFGLFMLIFGFSVCTALAFAYVARYTLLLLLISLAPLTITIGVIPQLRWLYWLWFKGLIMALLLGPINALLLKMAQMAALSGLGEVPGMFGGLVKFLAAAGILSILLAIDYAVIRGVFGAAAEIANKTKQTVVGVVAGLVTVGGAILTGGIAGLGAAGAAAGAAAGGGGGAAGAGGSGVGVAAAGGVVAGSSGAGSGAGGTAGATAASRNPSGASATREALADPGFLHRMGSMLQTAGQGGMASRNPVARAAAGVARGVGSSLSERGRRIERGLQDDNAEGVFSADLRRARTEAQAQSQHGGWAGLLTGYGISTDEEGFDRMSQSLSQLSDRYGGAAVRGAAPDVLPAMAAAQRHGGISLQQHAESAGYKNPGDFVGGEIEQRLWGSTGKPDEPVFPSGHSMRPDPWKGSGPSAYDYRRGTRLARSLGRHGADQVDAYARLSWAVRNPAHGQGEDAVDALDQAAGRARYAARDAQGRTQFGSVAWPEFAAQANQLTTGLGIENADLPSAWLAESQFLAKGHKND